MEEQRKNHEEYQYLDLMEKIIEEGVDRPNRTGTDARSIFTRGDRA